MHVLKLKRNLIFVGMLDEIGYVIRLKNHKLKLLNGSMVIMMGSK